MSCLHAALRGKLLRKCHIHREEVAMAHNTYGLGFAVEVTVRPPGWAGVEMSAGGEALGYVHFAHPPTTSASAPDKCEPEGE